MNGPMLRSEGSSPSIFLIIASFVQDSVQRALACRLLTSPGHAGRTGGAFSGGGACNAGFGDSRGPGAGALRIRELGGGAFAGCGCPAGFVAASGAVGCIAPAKSSFSDRSLPQV